MSQNRKRRDPRPLTAPKGIPALKDIVASEGSPQVPVSPNEILIVTGRSGAGRSQAANALEDHGWYVVDNLPPAMLLTLAGMMTSHGEGVNKLAAVVDVRGREFFHTLEDTLVELREHRVPYRIIFLDAEDQCLVSRYEANRRRHPLQGSGTLLDGLAAERHLLAPLRDRADEVIDTTRMSVHDLARHMRDVVVGYETAETKVTVQSFGFKHGMPLDADHVLDVRFVENPYWVEELRDLSGRDPGVAEFVLSRDGVSDLVDTYSQLILDTLPGYRQELKQHVTVAVGCTGGRHRSVAIAEKIASNLRDAGVGVHVRHRDSGKK